MTTSSVLANFLELARSEPDAPAVMVKRYGLWQRTSRGELLDQVARTAAGLAEVGIGAGTTVLFLAADQLEWLVVDLAAQATGARVSAVAPDTPDDVVLRVAAAAQARVAFVSEQEAVDRLLDHADAGALDLERIIEHRPQAAGVARDDRVRRLDDLVGDASADIGAFADRVARLAPEATAVIAVSSGTTGDPRVAAITHGALAAGARAVVDEFGLGPDDRVLSFRPLADPTERTTTIYASLLSGAVLALPESRSDTPLAMYEVAPTYVHLTRRWLDRTAEEVTGRLGATRGVKGLVSRGWARRAATNEQVPPAGPHLRIPIVEKLGLDEARVIVVSGSPLGAHERSFADAFRLPVRVAYSLTELGGIATVTSEAGLEDHVGAPLPGVEIAAEAGEVVLSGPTVPTGRLATGDRGELRAGVLHLTGPLDDTIEVGGHRIARSQVEAELRRSTFVREAAVAVVDDRVVVAVELTEQPVLRWAASNGVTFATFHGLADTDAVRDHVRRELEPLAAAAGLERIDELRVLTAPLEDVTGALTPSGRVRRDVMLAAGRAGSAQPSRVGVA